MPEGYWNSWLNDPSFRLSIVRQTLAVDKGYNSYRYTGGDGLQTSELLVPLYYQPDRSEFLCEAFLFNDNFDMLQVVGAIEDILPDDLPTRVKRLQQSYWNQIGLKQDWEIAINETESFAAASQVGIPIAVGIYGYDVPVHKRSPRRNISIAHLAGVRTQTVVDAMRTEFSQERLRVYRVER